MTTFQIAVRKFGVYCAERGEDLNGSTDYIELYIYQNSGANANLANWGSHTNYLSIVGPF